MAVTDIPPKDDELAAPDTDEGDADWLKKNFSGKTRAEAIRMFEQRAAANIAGDFLFMSCRGLAYYLPAALDYLRSPASKGDGDFLDWILGSLSIRREHGQSLPAEIVQIIRDIGGYLKEADHKFSCCTEHHLITTQYAEELEVLCMPG